ncbi:hypothetical protein [Tahibacter aquaticus]|uniref:hypothetical protein n=1 Tax=Tahibacter aquaticus TaxID=520092 RepID=UPI00106030D5|nr:hypothetical protein [Tahibacter aquaticus]
MRAELTVQGQTPRQAGFVQPFGQCSAEVGVCESCVGFPGGACGFAAGGVLAAAAVSAGDSGAAGGDPDAMQCKAIHQDVSEAGVNAFRRTVCADVVALDQSLVYNRFGSFNPFGMMFALRRDVVPAGRAVTRFSADDCVAAAAGSAGRQCSSMDGVHSRRAAAIRDRRAGRRRCDAAAGPEQSACDRRDAGPA